MASKRAALNAQAHAQLVQFHALCAEIALNEVGDFDFGVREVSQKLANGYHVEFSIRKHKKPSAQKLAAKRRRR